MRFSSVAYSENAVTRSSRIAFPVNAERLWMYDATLLRVISTDSACAVMPLQISKGVEGSDRIASR